MSRGTRSGRQSVATIPSDDEEAEEPSQPAVSASDLAETKQDYTRFVFLQAIMQRGVMKESEAKQMYCELTESTSDAGYEDFVADINEPLMLLHLKLKRTIFILDSEWYIGFINELPDENSKIGSSFEIPQRAYFQSLLEHIATADNSSDGKPFVRSTDAINVSMSQATMTQLSQLESSSQTAASLHLTLAKKQDTLKQLVDEGWLAKTPDQAGAYSIGVRSFLELSSYLANLDLPESTQVVWSKFL